MHIFIECPYLKCAVIMKTAMRAGIMTRKFLTSYIYFLQRLLLHMSGQFPEHGDILLNRGCAGVNPTYPVTSTVFKFMYVLAQPGTGPSIIKDSKYGK